MFLFDRIILLPLFLVGEQKNQIPCYYSPCWNSYGLGSATLDFKQWRNSLELGIETVLNQEPEYFSPENYTSGQEYKRNYLMLKKFMKAKLQKYEQSYLFQLASYNCIKKKKNLS